MQRLRPPWQCTCTRHSVILPESAAHLPVNFFVKLGSFLLGFFWGIVGCPAPSPPADPPPHPRASPNALGRGKADVTRLKASDLTMISKYNYAKSHESACLLRSELRRVSEGHLIRLLLSVLQLGRVPDEEELKLLPKLSHAWPKNRPFQERPKGLKPQSYKGTKKTHFGQNKKYMSSLLLVREFRALHPKGCGAIRLITFCLHGVFLLPDHTAVHTELLLQVLKGDVVVPPTLLGPRLRRVVKHNRGRSPVLTRLDPFLEEALQQRAVLAEDLNSPSYISRQVSVLPVLRCLQDLRRRRRTSSRLVCQRTCHRDTRKRA